MYTLLILILFFVYFDLLPFNIVYRKQYVHYYYYGFSRNNFSTFSVHRTEERMPWMDGCLVER